MDYNELLQRVKNLVNGATEEQFASAVLSDGQTRVEYEGDEIASGKTLYVVDSQGERQAAPEGTHTLESGKRVTVDSEGTITEVKEPESEGEGENPELAELRDRVAKMEELLRETVETMKQDSQERDKKQEEMEKAYENLSKAPASDPSEKTTAEEVFGKAYENLKLSEKVQLNLKNQ